MNKKNDRLSCHQIIIMFYPKNLNKLAAIDRESQERRPIWSVSFFGDLLKLPFLLEIFLSFQLTNPEFRESQQSYFGFHDFLNYHK